MASDGSDGELYRGRWALVTGASSGLGEEFARQLAARGVNLILTARSGDKLQALAAALTASRAVRTEVVALNLGAPGGALRLVEAVEQLGHPVDLLVSNAGFGLWGELATHTPDRLADMVRLNCEALVVLTRSFLPGMVGRRAGGVIHVASLASFQATPFMATYGATKALVLSFSEGVGEEVRPSGVRVMALCPGPVRTGFQAVAGADVAPSQEAAVISAEETVRQALGDFERRRAICVPGAMNRLSLLGSRLAPRGLLVRTVGKMMRGKRAG